MYKMHIVALLLYLAAIATCEIQEDDPTTVALPETTTDITKVVEKRQTLEASALVGATTGGVPDNLLGLSSVGLQVIGGLFQNMISTHGINSQAVASFLNLFKPEKLRSDLLLVRRGFNLISRFGVVLNRYLPNPTSASGFGPLDLLKSKVRFYTPQSPENVQWIAVNKNKSSKFVGTIPVRVQTMVDYVTQRPLDSSTTQQLGIGNGLADNNELEVTNELETNKNQNEETTKTSENVDIPEDNLSVVETNSSISTSTNQDYPLQVNSSTIEEKNIAKPTLQTKYGPPHGENKSENVLEITNLLLEEDDKVKSTPVVKEDGLPSNTSILDVDSKGSGVPPSKTNSELDKNTSQPKDGIDNRLNTNAEEGPQVFDLLTNNYNSERVRYEALQKAQIIPHYGLPATDAGSLTYRPIVQYQYGVPPQIDTNFARRDKTGLPLPYRNQVFALVPYEIQPNSFATVADLPLDQHTIYDRVHGPLRDSFGYVARN